MSTVSNGTYEQYGVTYKTITLTDGAYALTVIPEKGGMATRGIFLQKQARFGGYQDKIEARTDTTVKIIHGSSMDESDFK